ncbi:hypothetical protein [Cyclobacterium plantarum]|uniref:Class IIb bacteriocin, lactobin A/cerein 7B family n=1 Tax=Cyclobacterium plantarum TaxID=2716263 RepID=A0ABX0HEM5_9BACT|nr:hypothetical protein [Cyclobacterium plantarum]NHE58627.1 hypothetical protein [Cyclobacterium plantarum]
MNKFKELNNSEKEKITGGFLPVVGVGLKFFGGALFGAALVELVTEGWDSVKRDFNEGYNEVRIK